MDFYSDPKLNAVSIETMNLCTRDCWFCKFGQEHKPEKAIRLSLDTIEKILTELGNAQFNGRISPYGINEPLMDKRIFEICQMIRSKVPYAYVFMLTNGDLLTEEIVEKYRAINVEIGVSAYDEHTIDKCKNWRVATIDRTDTGFAENRGGNIFQLSGETRVKFQCLRPSTLLQIKANGKAVLCCCDFYGDVILGDVVQETLHSIWYGDRITKIRTHLRESGRKGLKLCEKCNHDGSGHPVYFSKD